MKMSDSLQSTTNVPKTREHPNGSVQGICSGSIAILALFIAFVGFTSFKNPGPWRWLDLIIQILPGMLGAIALTLVPWLTTKPQYEVNLGDSIENGRKSFIIGASLTLFAIIVPWMIDYFAHHEPNQ
jgi:hypothetical protein